ncbi:MAG: carbon storage regulator CsrA [Treponema sp.]|nr:carbon storage regulator CsrA [Treponema sp.]
MLILARKIDEKIKIGNDITITLISVQGDQVKIGVEAPKNVKVFRQEVYDAIQQENKAALLSSESSQNEVSLVSKLFKKHD